MNKKSFAEFLGEVETYPSVLAPGLLARPMLGWAAVFRAQAIVASDVEAYEVAHGNPFDWNLKALSEALGPILHKVCRGSAGVKLKAVLKTDGFNDWRVLAFWFQTRSTNDSISLLTMIMNPDRVKDLTDMMNMLDLLEMKFEKDVISNKMLQSKQHCSLWLPKPGSRTGWLPEMWERTLWEGVWPCLHPWDGVRLRTGMLQRSMGRMASSFFIKKEQVVASNVMLPNPFVSAGTLKACALIGLHLLAAGVVVSLQNWETCGDTVALKALTGTATLGHGREAKALLLRRNSANTTWKALL